MLTFFLNTQCLNFLIKDGSFLSFAPYYSLDVQVKSTESKLCKSPFEYSQFKKKCFGCLSLILLDEPFKSRFISVLWKAKMIPLFRSLISFDWSPHTVNILVDNMIVEAF